MEQVEPVSLRRDLSGTDAWFRDSFYKVLGWGSALILLVAGWTVTGNGPGVFSGCKCLTKGLLNDVCQRSIGLGLGYPMVFFFWIYLVRKLRSECGDHATIPSKGHVDSYLAAMAVLSVIILAMILID